MNTPSSKKWILWATALIALLSLCANFLLGAHALFYAVFGFITYGAIIIFAKLWRNMVMRDENYYIPPTDHTET